MISFVKAVRLLPLLVLSCLTGSEAAAADQAFRFVVLSDLHLGKNDNVHRAAYDQMVAEWVEARIKPAAVFVIGDVSDKGLEPDYDNFNAWFAEPLKQAAIPLYAIPGAREYGALSIWTNKIGPLYQAVSLQQTRFILTSSEPGGTVESNQLAWIGRELDSPESKSAKLLIILSHYPLWKDDFSNFDVKQSDPSGSGNMLKLWADTNGVDLVLCGYHHYQSPPIMHEFAGGRSCWQVLIESAVLGRTYKMNDAKGRMRTFNGFGYSIFDVAGDKVSHQRKVLDSSGFSMIGPVNTFDVTLNQTNAPAAVEPPPMAELKENLEATPIADPAAAPEPDPPLNQ